MEAMLAVVGQLLEVIRVLLQQEEDTPELRRRLAGLPPGDTTNLREVDFPQSGLNAFLTAGQRARSCLRKR